MSDRTTSYRLDRWNERPGADGSTIIDEEWSEHPQPDTVLAWDVIDGGTKGAVIVCRDCRGVKRVPTETKMPDSGLHGIRHAVCCTCGGSGEMHRPYEPPQRYTPADPEEQ